MIVAIHQPQYLPRMQFFDKIANADTFVFMDDVQFSNNNYQHYNYITGNRKIKLPLTYHFGDPINKVEISGNEWADSHIKMIRSAYAGYPFCDAVVDFLNGIYSKQHCGLSDISCDIIESAMERFGIHTKVVMASDIKAVGKKQDRVIDICKKLGATVYLSGKGASVYQSDKDFSDNGIRLEYMKDNPDFDNLSFVDYVAKNGFDYRRWRSQ